MCACNKLSLIRSQFSRLFRDLRSCSVSPSVDLLPSKFGPEVDESVKKLSLCAAENDLAVCRSAVAVHGLVTVVANS